MNTSLKISLSLSILFIGLADQNNLLAQIADKIFTNAKVYTTNNTFEEALAIKDGNIIYVGSNAGTAIHTGSETQVEDLGGRLMLPGIHDVHMHPLEAGSTIGGDCILDNQAANPDGFPADLGLCNLSANSNGWITASGHSIFSFLDAQPAMTRYPFELLDDVYPNTPAVVMEETSHSVWINTKAMEELGITSNTPDPVGGHIIKDTSNDNTPTGILLDNAGDLALKAAFASNTTTDGQNKDGLVNYSLPLLAENGITSICEGRTYWKRNYHTIWQSIKNDGDLTCRVVLSPWAYPEDDNTSLIPALQALYNTGDGMLRTTHIKVYSDGILINATAAMHEDYELTSWDFPFTKGLNYIDENRLTGLITALEQTGFDFHIHAIGDRGITEALNAIEAAHVANPTLSPRHRVTHLEVVKPSDYGRFQSLNVTADMQVAGNFTNPSNWTENEFLIGARSNNIIPLKSLYDAGARVVLSSDWDVSSVNPFVGMQNALTRSPQELPNVEEAVKAYTINAAYVMRQEANTGSLEVGKWADLIVVNKDIFSIPTNQIATTKTLLTYVAGEQVYRSSSLVLPVDLMYFEVTEEGCHIKLEWATSAELNNDRFLIERSTNGKYFEIIGEVLGQGTSAKEITYFFTDSKPSATSYYRLRQIDFDQKENLSPIVTARRRCEELLVAQILPNITSNLSMIRIAGGHNDDMQIELLSSQGRVIKEFTMVHTNKISQSPLNVSFLPEGVYYLRIFSANNQYLETKTFIVSR